MHPANLNLPAHLFALVFPFHIVFTRDLQIIQVGEVLQRISPEPLVASNLMQHFRVLRPKMQVNFDSIYKKTNSLFILESLQNQMQLKGQMVYDSEKEVIFFLCSLWVTDTAMLTPLGVKLKDFAIHDPIADFLFSLQAKNTALAEAKQLTDELTQKQQELQNALRVKADLVEIAQAQAEELELAFNKLQQTQAQLIQTEKMSSLAQLVAGIAHEINNPVGFIYGNIDYVNNYAEDLLTLLQLYQQHYPNPPKAIDECITNIDIDFIVDDLPKTLNSMKAGAKRIKEIVLSLRNFSRLDEADIKAVDIHEGIDSTLLMLRHRLCATGNRLEIQIVKDYANLPLVECYTAQLNQVFLNILTNAIDAIDTISYLNHYSPNNSKVITFNQATLTVYQPRIEIKTEVSGSDKVVITIVDNGPGMTADIKEKVFDHFFTTKPIGQGTGLGLSTCYQIITQQHLGSLSCRSEPGEGTEFAIEIPIWQR